jgi:esterase/lipase
VTNVLIIVGLVALVIWLVFRFAPRPRLDTRIPRPTVPPALPVHRLGEWLREVEDKVKHLIPGSEATIEWANPEKQEKMALCFLYVHGFSATRQETSPITQRLAASFTANTVHARLAGHGMSESSEPGPMEASAEEWLQSLVDAWHLAEQLGDKVVIVGTSTGATLSVWLAHQHFTQNKIHALLFMSPNFKIRNPLGFLLTWPWAPRWVPLLIGRERTWQPVNELEAKYWTSRYSIQAVIEMQKTVDWFRGLDLSSFNIPLATMYMKNDATIDSTAAVRAHEAWGADKKQLIPVTLDGEQAQHVFAGDITAPHRVDWCVERFEIFLQEIDNQG